MVPLKDEVLAKSAAVPTPDGAPLTESGKLSDVLITDGKVFCSITVDAAKVKAWESVRAKAESATAGRALGDDRTDGGTCFGWHRRRGGAFAASCRGAVTLGCRPSRCRARASTRSVAARRHSRRVGHYRGCFGKRRCRQIHDRGQSLARPPRSRPQGRHSRRRHLRAFAAKTPRLFASGRRPPAATG